MRGERLLLLWGQGGLPLLERCMQLLLVCLRAQRVRGGHLLLLLLLQVLPQELHLQFSTGTLVLKGHLLLLLLLLLLHLLMLLLLLYSLSL